MTESVPVDKDWLELIKEAKRMGLDPHDVKNFLAYGEVPEPVHSSK